MERTRRNVLTALVAAVAALVVVGLVAWAGMAGGEGAAQPLVVPGEGVRVTVEVLNATGVDGLARDVARRLRQAGIDVVTFGSARDTALDSTTILIRRGDSSAARRVREALGLGRIVVQPDPRLLLDASVLIGRDLRRRVRLHP